jgi:hypothetical protein
MINNYNERFTKIVKAINSDAMKEYARLNHPKSFSRKRKMPLKDIVLCTLSKKGLTTSMELHKYFIEKGAASSMNISKQGYLQQRKKLNYEAFSFLNREYLQDFYSSDEPVLWNNYMVFAIDGSKVEVPNSDENRVAFGECGNHHSKGEVRAMASCMFDVFNHFFLDLQIGSIKASESELAKQNIKAAKGMLKDTEFIIVFDRGYPSIEFVHFLEKNNLKYLFRLSSNDYKKERELMTGMDESIKLIHTRARLAKIKKNHPEVVEELKTKGYTSTRIITSILPSGDEISLITNLPFEISGKEIVSLYFKRWEIEKKYHTLKNKMKFESITGKATLYVYQDFWAQIVIYNMIQDVLNASNEELTKESKIQEYKYPIRINENIAIGLFKENFIKILIEPNNKGREEKLIQLQQAIERYVVPLRKLKSQDRKHNLSNKYKNNHKSSF